MREGYIASPGRRAALALLVGNGMRGMRQVTVFRAAPILLGTIHGVLRLARARRAGSIGSRLGVARRARVGAVVGVVILPRLDHGVVVVFGLRDVRYVGTGVGIVVGGDVLVRGDLVRFGAAGEGAGLGFVAWVEVGGNCDSGDREDREGRKDTEELCHFGSGLCVWLCESELKRLNFSCEEVEMVVVGEQEQEGWRARSEVPSVILSHFYFEADRVT